MLSASPVASESCQRHSDQCVRAGVSGCALAGHHLVILERLHCKCRQVLCPRHTSSLLKIPEMLGCAVLMLLLAPAVGHWTDTHGRKPFIALACLLSVGPVLLLASVVALPGSLQALQVPCQVASVDQYVAPEILHYQDVVCPKGCTHARTQVMCCCIDSLAD